MKIYPPDYPFLALGILSVVVFINYVISLLALAIRALGG